MNMAIILTIYQHTSSKTECFPKPPIAAEIATAVFLEPISKRSHRIDLARPAIDVATAPDDTTILRASITLRPSPRHHCTMLPRLDDADTAETHRSTSTPTPSVVCSKNDAPNW
jgi:hypothetical protein